MGWAPGYVYDVFISYARVDNATVENDPAHGWVSQFQKHLEVALSRKVGRLDTIQVWRDTRELQGNQLFDDAIQKAIGDSAVFIALTSHGYLQSQYCLQELDWFQKKAKSEPLGLAVGQDYRIFNLLLNNLPQSAWPPAFGRTTGFALHDAPDTKSDGEPSPLTSDSFRKQLRALVDGLCLTLTAIRERDAAPAPTAPTESKKIRVFLADASDTLAGIRKRVVNELKQSPEIELSTNVPPPFEMPAHDEVLAAHLKQSDLSVHLLDAFPGREIPDRDGSYYPRQQLEVARAIGTPQLIWVPQGLSLETVEDERYREFLTQLENGPRDRASYDFQRELPSAITRQILAKAEALKRKLQPPEVSAPDATLLDTHIKDQMYALELGQYLIKRQVQPFIVPQEDDPTSTEKLFSESLKRAAILIVVYGAVTLEWVRARLAHAVKIALMTEGSQLRACGVYMAPPRKADNIGRFSVPAVPVQWMDHTSGFNAEALDELLARARASRADS